MRSKLLAGVLGVVIAVALVAVVGAVYGAALGIPIYGPEYGHLRGLDGALAGSAVFLLYAGLPAAVLGAVGGVFAARRKQTAT